MDFASSSTSVCGGRSHATVSSALSMEEYSSLSKMDSMNSELMRLDSHEVTTYLLKKQPLI